MGHRRRCGSSDRGDRNRRAARVQRRLQTDLHRYESITQRRTLHHGQPHHGDAADDCHYTDTHNHRDDGKDGNHPCACHYDGPSTGYRDYFASLGRRTVGDIEPLEHKAPSTIAARRASSGPLWITRPCHLSPAHRDRHRRLAAGGRTPLSSPSRSTTRIGSPSVSMIVVCGLSIHSASCSLVRQVVPAECGEQRCRQPFVLGTGRLRSPRAHLLVKFVDRRAHRLMWWDCCFLTAPHQRHQIDRYGADCAWHRAGLGASRNAPDRTEASTA